jgi:hypothetical protein
MVAVFGQRSNVKPGFSEHARRQGFKKVDPIRPLISHSALSKMIDVIPGDHMRKLESVRNRVKLRNCRIKLQEES